MKKTATASELADIFGVTRSAVSQAVSSGRLSKSIVKNGPKQRLFEIYASVLEWENGRDNSQVRGGAAHGHATGAFPAVAESRQAFEYYQAVNEQLAALKAAGKLVDLGLAQNEVFMAARILRDRLSEIPEKMRFTFLSFGLADADVTAIIQALQDEIYQALLHLSEMDLGEIREQLPDAVQIVADGLPGVADAATES